MKTFRIYRAETNRPDILAVDWIALLLHPSSFPLAFAPAMPPIYFFAAAVLDDTRPDHKQ